MKMMMGIQALLFSILNPKHSILLQEGGPVWQFSQEQ